MENIRLRENQHRSLGYAPEFRQVTAEHPGVLGAAMLLAQQAEEKYKPRNVKVGAWEFGWSPVISQFETVKIGRKRIKPEHRVTYGQRIPLSRGVLFSPGKTLRDKATGLEVTALGISKREFATGFLGMGDVFAIDDTAYILE